jgi:AcrR family transcriptional regulator
MGAWPEPAVRLRSDAARNRRRLLAAASEAFAERGLEVGVDEIARRAGVGTGTLYRRFPTKDALIAAVQSERFDELAELADAALAVDDAWDAFTAFMVAVVERQATDRGFRDIISLRLRREHQLAPGRARVQDLLRQLVRRAQADGAIRDDVSLEDVTVLIWGAGRIVESTVDVDPEFWRRYLTLVLDALRAPPGTPLPGAPLTPGQLDAAMAP